MANIREGWLHLLSRFTLPNPSILLEGFFNGFTNDVLPSYGTFSGDLVQVPLGGVAVTSWSFVNSGVRTAPAWIQPGNGGWSNPPDASREIFGFGLWIRTSAGDPWKLVTATRMASPRVFLPGEFEAVFLAFGFGRCA